MFVARDATVETRDARVCQNQLTGFVSSDLYFLSWVYTGEPEHIRPSNHSKCWHIEFGYRPIASSPMHFARGDGQRGARDVYFFTQSQTPTAFSYHIRLLLHNDLASLSWVRNAKNHAKGEISLFSRCNIDYIARALTRGTAFGLPKMKRRWR